MIIQNRFSNAFALLTTGILAGIFFYATFFVSPAFWDVPAAIHLNFRVALMGHNAVIMQLIMALTIGATLWFGWSVRNQKLSRVFSGLAIVFTIATLLITRLGNVPMNFEIKT